MDMLTGSLVRLRELRREDLDVLTEHYNDADVVRYLAFWNAPMGREDAIAFFERAVQRPPETRVMAIARLEDDAFVGSTGFHGIDWRNRTGGIGIAIWAPDGRDRGYGTEAVELLVRHGFETLNLHRVELSVWEFNPRAIRVYEKLGFVHEGRKRQSRYWEGRYWDELLMSVLRQEWEAARQGPVTPSR